MLPAVWFGRPISDMQLMLPRSAPLLTMLSSRDDGSGGLAWQPSLGCRLEDVGQPAGLSEQASEHAAAEVGLVRLPFFLGLPLAAVAIVGGGAPASSSRLANSDACQTTVKFYP